LAVLAWQWLQDADPSANAQGAAAGGVLALAVAVSVGLWRLVPARAALRARLDTGARGPLAAASRCGRWWGGALLIAVYGAVFAALALGSVAGVWPFPDLWPETLSTRAWASVWDGRVTVLTTLGLAAASASLALAWSVAWLETAPRRWNAGLRPLLYLPLVTPAVLWVVGLYGAALWLRIEGRWSALLAAHTLMALPYVLLALEPAYLGFDPRHRAVSSSLGHGRARFLLLVKWPLLRRALAASAAVGFAVSVAQYLPTLYLGAGRWSTVTTEAVSLAAGGQRSLTSAYAGLQFALPLLGFALAAWVGRPRRFAATSPEAADGGTGDPARARAGPARAGVPGSTP
jgi:putative thiamine transport system permease protein